MTNPTPAPEQKVEHTPEWTWHEDRFRGGYSGLYGANGEEIVVPQCCNDGDTGAAWFENVSDEHRDLIASALASSFFADLSSRIEACNG